MPDFDTRELDSLATDFTVAASRVVPALVPVAQRAGVNMKRQMKRDASGHSHLPALPRYVEYDVTHSPLSVTVEVGFRKEGQGNLANIAAFGSANNAPVMDITAPLAAELPKFVAFAAKAAAEALN